MKIQYLVNRAKRALRLYKILLTALTDLGYVAAMLRKEPIREMPALCYRLLRVSSALLFDSGYVNAMFRRESIDRDGNKMPWFTYPCLEYLRQLDLSAKNVFEWGSGNSTLFWADKCNDVTSVENDQTYYQKVKSCSRSNVSLFLEVEPSKYVNKIAQCNKKFDIIVIDGPDWRLDCAQLAIQYLSDEGIIILDNSDGFSETARFLGDQNLIQVDFNGFGPLCERPWVTSLFFEKNATIKRIEKKQAL
jgi:hypothetical protein